MKSLTESILSSNNVSLITIFKNLAKRDSDDECEELNNCWKMLHLDIPNYKWDNIQMLNLYEYVDSTHGGIIYILYEKGNISYIIFSSCCDKSYKEKVVKTLKLKKDMKENTYIIK